MTPLSQPQQSTSPNPDELRLAGNAAFANKDYDQCILMYTFAIDEFIRLNDGDDSINSIHYPPIAVTEPTEAATDGDKEKDVVVGTTLDVHYCNRSLVYSLIEDYSQAIFDAKSCIRLSKNTNIKGFYRLIKAYSLSHLYEEAIEVLENEGLVYHPGDVEMVRLTDVMKRKRKDKQKILEKNNGEEPTPFKITSLKTDGRKPQVKEFDFMKELGVGNFSRIVTARHKVTKEVFAVKVIEKKQVDQLKRRHPNVHNEIFMERRVLSKLKHPFIVELYQTFQDYNALYFLMELCDGAEMWTRIVKDGKLVGCYPTLSAFYIAELLEVLEYLHKQGIVHRDLKPENLMVSLSGHLKLIDFGTAKDLVETDKNGPEFVGTPEFMSPEAVKSSPSGVELDIWAVGILVYQMFLGTTPFKSPSPYLGFLKIKRGHIYRLPALTDDAWEVIQKTVRVDPSSRSSIKELKAFPFFKGFEIGKMYKSQPMMIPSLRDLCIPKVADLAVIKSSDISNPSPGEGGKYDMMRLNGHDRNCVMHLLDRLDKLIEPRVYNLFFETSFTAKMSRVRPNCRDFVGMNSEREGQFTTPFTFCHIPINDPDQDISELKNQVKTINKARPRFVVVTGQINQLQVKIIAKISETINFAIADGSNFFVFYGGGCHCIILVGSLFTRPEANVERAAQQMAFLAAELEQSKMCQHHTFVFTEIDPRLLPSSIHQKLSTSRVCGILGPTNDGSSYSNLFISNLGYDNKSELDSGNMGMDIDETDGDVKEVVKWVDDDASSDEEEDSESVNKDVSVKVVARGKQSLIMLDEERQWAIEDMVIQS